MRRALLAVLGSWLALAGPAAAAAPGTWERFTDGSGSNITNLGVHRTADGVLHAVWSLHDSATNTDSVFHRTVTSAGALGATNTVVTWPSLSDPDITAAPGGGLVTLWGGINGPIESGSATSNDSGAAWTEGGEPIHGDQVYASVLSIEPGADGTLFESFFGTLGTWVHRGTDPSSPSSDFQAQFGGYAFSAPNLARDGGDGSLWLGWPIFSAGQNNGAWAQQVDQATGAPAGAPMKMPGSSTEYQGNTEGASILGRWAVTGRPGKPGVFMAAPAGYPSAKKILLWRVGAPSSVTLDDADSQHRQVAIAADPDGRIIVVWGTDGTPRTRLFARVSDTDAKTFGPAFEISTPPGMTSLWAIAVSAQSGGLFDLFANVTESDNQTERYYHTQALPPPVLAKAVNARVLSGQVLIELPGTSTFVPLTHDSQIPVGATVDATKGRLRIVTALPNGKTQSADFFQGVFRVTQAKTGLATMALVGGAFSACGKARRAARAAKAKEIRRLWAAGSGRFATKGRYASATIRGTTWLTVDRCDGTLIRVTQGRITVRPPATRHVVVLRKGQSLLVPARR